MSLDRERHVTNDGGRPGARQPAMDRETAADPPADAITEAERMLIRREFCQGFGSGAGLAGGVAVQRRRTGPQAGQPSIPKAMLGLVERGLMALTRDDANAAYRAHFTPSGLVALRALLRDERRMNPLQFAHLRRELGLDPPAPPVASGDAAV